jgi:hypothetical protein
MRKIALVGLGLVGALAVLLTPSIAAANSQSFSTPVVSANPVAGMPVTLTETGSSDPSSTMTVSAQPGGGACTPAAVQIDSAVVSGNFTHVTTFTPAEAGTYTICFVFTGANGTQSESFSLDVAPPPPPPPAPAPTTPAPATARCVTHQLLRHTLAYAEHLLSKADCKLGRVYRPSQHTLAVARRRDGGRTPSLIVVSQTPHKPGIVAYAGAVVAVRLGVRPPPKPTPTHRT